MGPDDLQTSRLSRAFRDFLPLPAKLEPHLKEALGRVLDNPGSLIRPEIVLQIGLDYGVLENTVLDLAIGLEYFHTASLLFDDLPAMDDAVERRGMPCVHVEFGDAGAILAALALVNRAYALVWRAVANTNHIDHARALTYLEQHLGVDGLLNGQSLDLHFASRKTDCKAAAIGKTVSLIRLTLVLPAMLGGASVLELQLLERISLFWGLSYQIVDDLKDVLQSSSESGKTPSRDLFLGRPNFALAVGIKGAVERLQRLITLGDRMLDRLTLLRPGLTSLRHLRSELGEEAVELTQFACEPVAGGVA